MPKTKGHCSSSCVTRGISPPISIGVMAGMYRKASGGYGKFSPVNYLRASPTLDIGKICEKEKASNPRDSFGDSYI